MRKDGVIMKVNRRFKDRISEVKKNTGRDMTDITRDIINYLEYQRYFKNKQKKQQKDINEIFGGYF